MAIDIVSLQARESFWDAVTAYAAIAVIIGVALETVAQFESVFSRMSWLAQQEHREQIAKIGVLILLTALAVEAVGGIKTHNASKATVSALNGELSGTVKQATGLAELTSKLRLSNSDMERELSALSAHNIQFEGAVRSQEDRDDATLAALKKDDERLKQARSEIFAAAATSTTAAAQIKKDVQSAESMRQRMEEIVLPRHIDDEHWRALVSAIKGYPETPVEFALTRDNETADLFVQIADAVAAANWKIQAWSGGGFGLSSSVRPNLPSMGDVTARAVQVSFSSVDSEKLGPPSRALAYALSKAGISTGVIEVADKLADGKPNPQAVKAGVIRVVVGAKP